MAVDACSYVVIMFISAVLQKICALQLRCVVFADFVLGCACSYVVIIDNYAGLQTIHAKLRCVVFNDCVLGGACRYDLIADNYSQYMQNYVALCLLIVCRSTYAAIL